ncbi:MAG: FkbM family methyltransferase [Nanobdellota archaeon]
MAIDKIHNHSFFDTINEASVVVELGADKGQFAKVFTQKYTYKRLILVEANPERVKDLEALNLEAPILNAAISCQSKKASLYINHKTSSLIKSFAEVADFIDDTPTYTTPEHSTIDSITFNDLLNRFKLDHIDLLVVDIEGSEYELFESFDADVRQISVIFHDYLDPTYRKRTENIIQHMRFQGYEVIITGTTEGFGSPYHHCLFYKNH